jgi:hypothetical protein
LLMPLEVRRNLRMPPRVSFGARLHVQFRGV